MALEARSPFRRRLLTSWFSLLAIVLLVFLGLYVVAIILWPLFGLARWPSWEAYATFLIMAPILLILPYSFASRARDTAA